MHVFLIAAITQDGFIARETTEAAVWSSKEDKQFFHARTRQAGLMVMGQITYQTIGRPLPGRITTIYTRNPEKIPNSQDISQLPKYSTPSSTPRVFTTALPIPELIQLLSDKNYPELAICGGSSIYTQFMKSGVVNTLYLTTETTISFGIGIPLFTESINLPTPIKTTSLSPTTILNEYSLQKSGDSGFQRAII